MSWGATGSIVPQKFRWLSHSALNHEIMSRILVPEKTGKGHLNWWYTLKNTAVTHMRVARNGGGASQWAHGQSRPTCSRTPEVFIAF